jgi:hypothetical protein
VIVGNDTPDTFWSNEVRTMPPKPANPADVANTRSLLATGDTPEAAAALSDVRTATTARPVGDRRRLSTRSAASSTSAKATSANVRSSARSSGPSSGRGIDHPTWPLLNRSQANSTRSPMTPSARVARARGTPPRRMVGSATTRPAAMATSTPTSTATRNGTSCEINSPVVSAADVANAAWARLTMPPEPVRTTNDMNSTP